MRAVHHASGVSELEHQAIPAFDNGMETHGRFNGLTVTMRL